MKVDQQQQKSNMIDRLQQNSDVRSKGSKISFQDKISETCGQESSPTSVNMKDATYLKPVMEEQKTAVEEIEESAAMSARERKNQMAVLSNTASEEDYAKMQEDGFSLDHTTSNTIITVTDKIKAELAKAGVDISCFGDDLDMEQLEAIAGSAELAAQIVRALQKADLPVTHDNIKDTAEAVGQAESLNTPTEGAVKYMVDNQLAPTIENLYMAEFSGSSSYQPDPSGELPVFSLASQMEAIIKEAGYEVQEDTMKDSQWMLENGIPLTAENLTYIKELKGVEFPLDPQKMIEWITAAIAEGKRPRDTLLIPGQDLMQRAERACDIVNEATDEDLQYIVDHDMELTVENLEKAAANRLAEEDAGIAAGGEEAKAASVAEKEAASQTKEAAISGSEDKEGAKRGAAGTYTRTGLELLTAQRQLEEARLAMTAQANYSLMKQGIAIDTEPLVSLVEHLKTAENEYYAKLLSAEGASPSEENIALLRETTEKITELKAMPAYVLGRKEADAATIPAVHEAGSKLKESFDKANERYETLMTAPRKDMGDSIGKAFQNVDDILADLQVEATEENRRAVRILGYNELDITKESIMQMKAADEDVQRMFRNMTPQVVTAMIKKGINPLEMDFQELNTAAGQIREELGEEDNLKFSEYLWKLDQNHAISEEERSSYIGIYRLMRQVEKSDGAAVGALVNQGAELTMKNLLTAVRSERRGGKMDYAVDEKFQGAERTGGISITDQIEASYQNNCLKDVLDTVTPGKMRQVVEQASDWEGMTPEQLKTALEETETNDKQLDLAYAKEQLSQLESCAKATQDVYDALQKYDIPNTMANVMAMESMMKNKNLMFRQIFGDGVKDAKDEIQAEDLEKMRQELLEEFGEAVSEPADMAIAQEKLGVLAENVMKTMINSETVTSLDIREMRMLSAKLSISSTLAKEEQYSVPVKVNDELLNVSLKIVRGVDKKGVVDITMESNMHGKIAATFQAKEEGLNGFVAAENRETKELLEESVQQLAKLLTENENLSTDIHCAYVNDLDLNHFSNAVLGNEASSATEENSSRENYKIQTARLYHIAESFIRTIKETL